MGDGRGRPIFWFVGGSHRRKLAVLFVCWLIEGVFCAIFLRGDRLPVVPPVEVMAGSLRALPGNGTGAFSARCLDAEAGYQPAFFLRWRNLRAENGRIGIFKTPLHRSIKINDLHIRLYEHSQEVAERPVSASVPVSPDTAIPLTPDQNSGKSVAQAKFTRMLDSFRKESRRKTRGMRMDSPSLTSISNVSQVVISGLDYRQVRGDQVELGIQCRSATASGSTSEIVLRGTVIIQADDKRLMSNHVVWDVEKGQFSVPGTYILDHNGVPVRGSGIRCDHHLQPLVSPGVYSKKGVGTWTRGSPF